MLFMKSALSIASGVAAICKDFEIVHLISLPGESGGCEGKGGGGEGGGKRGGDNGGCDGSPPPGRNGGSGGGDWGGKGWGRRP